LTPDAETACVDHHRCGTGLRCPPPALLALGSTELAARSRASTGRPAVLRRPPAAVTRACGQADLAATVDRGGQRDRSHRRPGPASRRRRPRGQLHQLQLLPAQGPDHAIARRPRPDHLKPRHHNPQGCSGPAPEFDIHPPARPHRLPDHLPLPKRWARAREWPPAICPICHAVAHRR
jgi:hypothetical protein